MEIKDITVTKTSGDVQDTDWFEGQTAAGGAGSTFKIAKSELVTNAVDSVNGQTGVVVLDVTTREYDRAFSEELLFDKNEIEGELYVQDDVITFTVAETGHLTDAWSIYGQRITTDGVNPIYFPGFSHLSNITNGEVLEAGTYQFIFWHSPDGITRGSVMLPSEQVVTLSPLAFPASFAAAPDGDNEIDLSWTNNTNASSYEIQYSTSGGAGPWIALATPAAGSSSYSHTGLTPATTYHYRIRCIGDLINFANSAWTTTAATTEDAGDVTAPTFVFSPADAATDIDVNQVVTITASEPIRDADGVTEITSANVADYLTVKEDDGAGSDIPFTATIDAGKTIITITPNVVWPSTGDVFIEIDGVEDVNGNEATADDATFTTNAYTLANNNVLQFSGATNTALTNIFCVDNANFDILWTQKDLNLSIYSAMAVKWETGKRSFIFNNDVSGGDPSDMKFKFYQNGGADSLAHTREIIWAGPLSSAEQEVRLEYRGAIDTNNGLDRLSLYIDGVLQGSKTLVANGTDWPFFIRFEDALFRFGPSRARVKDLIIRSNNGSVTELNIPVMRTGIDISGNNRHGSWV